MLDTLAKKVLFMTVFVLFTCTALLRNWGTPDPEHTSQPKLETTSCQFGDVSCNTPVSSFSDIPPSEKLRWYSCHDGKFYCARLLVPMDYRRPFINVGSTPSVSVGMVMLPGRNHTTKETVSGSPVLLNPGGPGGSGVLFALSAAAKIQDIIGDEHDIIGFDPRAVGETTPSANCFTFASSESGEITDDDIAKGQFNRMQWQVAGDGIGIVTSSDIALELLDQRARAVTTLCKKKADIDANDSIIHHSSTTNVARDMLSIVDAWDVWIGRNVEKRPSADLQGQLLYWGNSYGTLLGSTFAAMFPGRVGRMLLDAVLDATHYVAPVWANSMQDTDAVLESFFKNCHLAKSKCSFYRSGDKEVDIRLRYDSVIKKLHGRKGIAVIAGTRPILITEAHVRQQLFSGLYQPVRLFPRSAAILDALYRGNNKALLANVPVPILEQQPSTYCPVNGSVPRESFSIFDAGQANMIISCSDKRYSLDESIPSLESLLALMSEKTAWADIWLNSQLNCQGWDIDPSDPPLPWDPDIPFSSPLPPFNVSNPILFTSSTLDPVCPFSSAVKMARKFRGSGVIQQLSEGHGISAVASSCTLELIRNYFKDGIVPNTRLSVDGKGKESWAKCEPDEKPFEPFDSNTWLQNVQDSERVEYELQARVKRLEAWKDIQEIMATRIQIGY